MDINPSDGDRPIDGHRDKLNVGDPVLRKTRLLSRECRTCIFKPGNLMHLEPGRLREMVDAARGDAGYIICHQTLPYADSPIPPAVCRGFADRYRTWQLQVMARLWGFLEVDPPDKTSSDATATDGTERS